MRVATTLLWGLVYVGGLVGSKQFYEARFKCELYSSGATSCGFSALVDHVLWPFEAGKEIAVWAYEQESARNRARYSAT